MNSFESLGTALAGRYVIERELGRGGMASFYRYSTIVLPAATPPDVAQDIVADRPAVFTFVLEKRDGDWKTVHTHVSELGPPARN